LDIGVRLEQLRFFCAIVDSGFSITRASEMLHISQPAVSKQIAAFEAELGADLLIRTSGRIVGLTAAGHATLTRARQVLIDIDDLLHIGRGLAKEIGGKLVIATTHTHARYALLDIIKEFRRAYPYVHSHLVQAHPAQVYQAIESGTADIGISSEEPRSTSLREFRGRDLGRSIIAPVGHPVFRESPLTLQGLSKHSLLTLDTSFPGGRVVSETFENAGIRPNIVMTATDSDVLKAYLRLGMGVAVLPTITFDRAVDQALDSAEATHLFGSAPSFILVQPDRTFPSYMSDLISRIVPPQN
jgi:DNA-binding transcriptional LysR family regulator